jgi:hypothetical protein
MGATYHPVYPSLWDRTMRELGGPAKVVRLYVLTCSHRLSEGLYHLPVGILQHDTGLEPQHVDQALRELTAARLVDYDPDAEVILDRTALKFAPLRNRVDGQTGEVRVDKRIAGAVRKLEHVPPTPLLAELYRLAVEHSPDLADALAAEWPALADQQPAIRPTPDKQAPSKPLASPLGAPPEGRVELRRAEPRRAEVEGSGEDEQHDQDEQVPTCGWCQASPARLEPDGRPMLYGPRPWCGVCEPVDPDPPDTGPTCHVIGCSRPPEFADEDGQPLCGQHQGATFGEVTPWQAAS